MSNDEAIKVIQSLVEQVQLLASLHWLSRSQVLACIPLGQPATIDDVADLCGLPADQLLRTIRATSSAGFLRQPLPGYVQHTHLSTQLLKRPLLTDFIAFFCDAAVPRALQMGSSDQLRMLDVQQYGHQAVARNVLSVDHEWALQPKRRREVVAYRRCCQRAVDDAVSEVLSALDWTSLGDATVVQVGTRSVTPSRVLSVHNPNVQFIAQVVEGEDYSSQRFADPSDPGMPPRTQVEIQARVSGSPQPVQNAAVYILHLPDASLSSSEQSLESRIREEVQVHFGVLRTNPNARLVVLTQVLPDPNSVDRKIDITARFQDLFLLQIGGEAMLSLPRLKELLCKVGDERGRLVVLDQFFSRQSPVAALRVKIEDFKTSD